MRTYGLALRLGICGAIALATGTQVEAQRAELTVDQVSPRTPVAVQQIDATQKALEAGLDSRPIPQLDRNLVLPAAPSQITIPSDGRDPSFRQTAPDDASRGQPSQLAPANTDPNLGALPRHLVDACDEAAAGRGEPPAGVDCETMVQAAASPRVISAEEALLTSADERNLQRLTSERLASGQSPDAAEVARRLSIGDLRNAPVAQAIAQQAAADAAAQQAQSGARPVVVPDGGAVVVQPNGN